MFPTLSGGEYLLLTTGGWHLVDTVCWNCYAVSSAV